MDGGGNVTQLSAHDESQRQIAKSHNVWTGEGRTVDLWKLAEAVEALTGQDDIVTDYTVTRRDWDVEEQKKVDAQDAVIAEWQVRYDEWKDAGKPDESDPGDKPKKYKAAPKPKWLDDWEKDNL